MTKPRMDFVDSHIKHWKEDQNNVLRCKACFTCTQCHLPKKPNQFSGNAHACITCSDTEKCHVCETVKGHSDFAKSQLSKYREHRNNTLRCIACHTFARCQEVKTAKQFSGNADACISCNAERSGLKCASCQLREP